MEIIVPKRTPLLFIFLCGFSFFPTSAMGAELALRVTDSVYANNLEYTGPVDRYREGETFFGNLFVPTAELHFLPQHSFNAGVLMRMPFGASKIIDPIVPIIAFHSLFFERQLQVIAGSLNTRHRTLEAILDNNLFYVRPVEYGLQGIADFEQWSGEAWIDWQRMESQLHNEKFDAGLTGEIKWKGLFGELLWHYSHMGGQLFQNADPVLDDNALAGGAGYGIEVPWVNRIELSGHRIFSALTNRGKGSREGRGFEARFSLHPSDWKIFASWWKGEEFFHEDGDPLYKAKEYVQFGIVKQFSFSKGFQIGLDARAKRVDGYFVHSEGVLFSWDWAFPLMDL